MEFRVGKASSQKEFLQNMELKRQEKYFTGDITGLIRPDEVYEHHFAMHF